jgi:hypothetical protein
MMMVDRRSLVLALVLVERVKNKFDLIDFFFSQKLLARVRHINDIFLMNYLVS